MDNIDFWVDPKAWLINIIFTMFFIFLMFKLNNWPSNTKLGVKLLTTLLVGLTCYIVIKIQIDK